MVLFQAIQFFLVPVYAQYIICFVDTQTLAMWRTMLLWWHLFGFRVFENVACLSDVRTDSLECRLRCCGFTVVHVVHCSFWFHGITWFFVVIFHRFWSFYGIWTCWLFCFCWFGMWGSKTLSGFTGITGMKGWCFQSNEGLNGCYKSNICVWFEHLCFVFDPLQVCFNLDNQLVILDAWDHW